MVYTFTLKFRLPSTDAYGDERVMERLEDCGCTDALAGFGVPGYVSLEFERESVSASEAMLSAITDVRRALPEAELVEAAPDYVGLTDIAEVAGVTRQNMRKLFVSYSSKFPPPVHVGSSMVWHLATVLQFMRARKYQISPDVFEVAHCAMQVNLSKEVRLLNDDFAHRVSRVLHSSRDEAQHHET